MYIYTLSIASLSFQEGVLRHSTESQIPYHHHCPIAPSCLSTCLPSMAFRTTSERLGSAKSVIPKHETLALKQLFSTVV